MVTESTQADTAKESRFDWPLCYEAESFILAQIDAFLVRNSFARRLSEQMRNETGTLLLDWVDYLLVSPQTESLLREAGYTEDPFGDTPANQKAFWHPEAMLPRVVIDSDITVADCPAVLAIRTEDISDFMVAHGVTAEP